MKKIWNVLTFFMTFFQSFFYEIVFQFACFIMIAEYVYDLVRSC